MSNVVRFPSPAVRAIDPPTLPARYHAEALMRALVRDKRNCREELAIVADLLDPMLQRMERDNG